MLPLASEWHRYKRSRLPSGQGLQGFLCCEARRNGRPAGRHAKRARQARVGRPGARELHPLRFPVLAPAWRYWRLDSCASAILYRNSATGESSPLRSVKNAMARETEIKLKITDVPAFHRALKRIGARPASPGTSKVHEQNVIFDTPQGGLAKHGQLLRIRTETPQTGSKPKKGRPKQRVVLTFKQPMVQPAGAQTGSASS